MEILVNGHFVIPEEPIKTFRDIGVRLEWAGKTFYYDKEVSRGAEITSTHPYYHEFTGRAYIVNLFDYDVDEERYFLLVNDTTEGWFAAYLFGMNIHPKVIEIYKRAKGLDVETEETKLIHRIRSVFGMAYKCHTEDSRYRIVEKSQRTTYGTSKAKKNCIDFYLNTIGKLPPYQKGKTSLLSHFYPDVTLFIKEKGKTIIEYIELEHKTNYTKSEYWVKLYKLSGTQRRIYFILEESRYENTKRWILKFHKEVRPLRSVYITRLEDFKTKGINSFDRLI